MRNLKRALSLALASVMLLGMMVVGTSAASYPDVDEKDNVEAIEVLNAVKVMIGDRGNFRPDAAVNRHEMAVIMAKLVLGNEAADNYVGSHPFTDVFPWADKYVAACYENGLVSGTSATTFSGNQPLTAVQAAAMMLRALGYKDLSKGASDWRAPVTAMANQIRLFNGVASNPKEELDRNQVAQLALNTLKSPVVDLKDGTFDISSGDGQVVITGGSREYIVRSSSESYAKAINDTEVLGSSASGVGGCTVELGEHLYNGKLELNDDSDDFERPARQWVYDGKEIGVYAKDELLRREYTTKVTGRDLYDQLGSSIVNNIDTGRDPWSLYAYVDGEYDEDFTKSAITRSNTDGVLGTGKGVLTQVFVDSAEKEVRIAVINTFLAIASEDYDSKNGEVDLTVYTLDKEGTKNPVYSKDKEADDDGITVTVEDEDIDVSAVKKDDMFLITVADGKVQTMTAPEVLSDREISSFKRNSDVVSEGKTYEYADTAKYDADVLKDYAQTNLKDNTYNIILDKYGYLIGLEQNEDPDQYVFLTGMDGNTSDLSTKNADANVIFLDGTMKTVTVNVKDSKLPAGGPQMNTWCTYSVDSKDVYILKQVGHADVTGWDVFQKDTNLTTKGSDDRTINNKNVSLPAKTGNAYGNDDTVYINVETDVIKSATATAANPDKPWTVIIDDVDSVTTGVRNVSLKVVDQTGTGDGDDKDDGIGITSEIYALYDDDGYIIAVVTIGTDDGVNKTYAYIHSDGVKRERYDKAKDEWTWVREAIVDGKIVDLTEVGGGTALSVLKNDVALGNWYEIKTNADGNVKEAKFLDTTTYNSSSNKQWIDKVKDVEDAVNGEDTVILQQEGMDKKTVELTLQGGTLYTDKFKSEKLGFSVSPDVKTVLCLSDGTGHKASHTKDGCFDDCSDKYTGRDGLDKAIKDLDSNFTGELNVVFNKGDAVVIILVDQTVDGDKDSGKTELEEGVSISGDDVTIQYSGNQPNAASIIKSIISALESTGYTGVKNVSLDSSAGTYSATALVGTTETDVTGNYNLVNVTVNEESVDSLVEAIEGEDGNTYSFKGDILVDGNDVTFKNTAADGDKYAADNTNLMNDLSRFLRGLYTEMGVRAIKFDGTAYKWDEDATHPDPDDPDGDPLPVKGSKWHSGSSYQASNDAGEPGNTLVGALMKAGADAITGGASLDGMSFTLTLDGTDFTVTIKTTA